MATPSPIKARANDAAQEELKNWPKDAEGDPMVRVTVGAKEKIGLEDYSNVDVGPFSVTMYIPKGADRALSDDDAKALASSINQLAELVEVEIAAANRDVVLNTIDPSKIK